MRKYFLFLVLFIASLLHDTQLNAQAYENKIPDIHFGMFICWSFSTFSDKDWTPGVTSISFFHPTGMDTDEWCRVAKDAGMDYILFLTKHHDGFAFGIPKLQIGK